MLEEAKRKTVEKYFFYTTARSVKVFIRLTDRLTKFKISIFPGLLWDVLQCSSVAHLQEEHSVSCVLLPAGRPLLALETSLKSVFESKLASSFFHAPRGRRSKHFPKIKGHLVTQSLCLNWS